MRDAAGVSTVVPGWPVAFRGSLAVGAGLTTWGRLRGPRFERLFPDVYCPTGDEPADLRLRSLSPHLWISASLRSGADPQDMLGGAYRLVEGRGVLAGYSAAVLLDADCARHRDVPAEVTVAGGGQRVHDGLVVRRDRIAPGETTWVDGVRCTSPGVGVSTTTQVRREGNIIRYNLAWTFVLLGYVLLVAVLFVLFVPHVMGR